MEMRIGQVIRELRKRNRVTQEQLAEYLGVTGQSVCKWETGTNLPDIVTLADLSAYFNVTVDYLLYGDQPAAEDEADLLNEAMERKHRGDRDGMIEKLTEGVKAYPRNYEIMLEYVGIIYRMRKEERYKDRVEGAIRYCKRMIAEASDSRIVYRAKHLLCLFYCGIDREKAREIAESLPDTPVCRDILLEKILKGKELEARKDTNLEHFLFYIWCRLQSIAHSKKLNADERIRACAAGIQLWEMFCYDGRLGLYHEYAAINYVDMAEIYAGQGEKERVLTSMDNAARHIRLYRESCDRDELITESVFWNNKNMARGPWKKEKADRLAEGLSCLLDGEFGTTLSGEELARAREALGQT